MSQDVMVLAEHLNGAIPDTTFELLGKAKELAGAAGGRVLAVLLGDPGPAAQLGTADVVVTVEHPSLASYNGEAYEVALIAILNQYQPRLLLVTTSTAGLDLAAALAARWDAAIVSYVVDLSVDGSTIVATAQLYGGKLMAEVGIEAERAICAVGAGSFPADAGRAGAGGAAESFSPPAGLDNLRTSFVALIAPDAGDVDITAADLLVAVGRGIGSQDNLELVEELAEALNAPLAASRPVTDLGWLPKTRQVGKSGLKVKPRAYLMFGISGAPEHLEGMRDADLIIACNTDEKAPIFDVAHYGTTADLFDLVPALAEKLNG